MDQDVSDKTKQYFTCEECRFHYEEKEWAEKCEAWCKEHKTCNVEITSHAKEATESQDK